MKILFIINDAPYGSEKAYNALRLAMALQKDSLAREVRVFLMADAVVAALPAQATPQGHYNVERMLESVMAKGGLVNLKQLALVEGADVSTMAQLADWTANSDKVLVF